jgi:hypothetical protein
MDEKRMHASLFAAAVVVAIATLLGGKAEAAAFCSYGSEGREACSYHTWEQCLASVRGAGGFCIGGTTLRSIGHIGRLAAHPG